MQRVMYSTREVSAVSGATLRQLQWWDERGILRPQLVCGPGRGRRAYTQDQLIHAIRLAEVNRRGRRIKLKTLAKIPASAERVVVIDKPTMVGETWVIPVKTRKHTKARHA